MGQGFALVDIEKKKYITPHAWGRGYKLCEFAFSFDTFAVLYELLLREQTSRIAFVGDNAMDEQDDEKRGFAPTNDQIDEEYRVLDTDDLRKLDGLRNVHGMGTPVARSAGGEQIDRSTFPDRVAFLNRSKRTFFLVDTKDVDRFTVAALVWFLVDVSTASMDDIIDVDASIDDDELLESHGGTWAYDSIAAHDYELDEDDDPVFERWRDGTEELRAVAAAFRRRNDALEHLAAPPGKRQRTISFAPSPRDEIVVARERAHETFRALCDDFGDKIQSRRLDVDALFRILHSVLGNDEWFEFRESVRFLSAALLMALERWGQKGDDDALRVVDYALAALASPEFDGERSTGGHLRGFGERAVVFAKHCGVPRSTYKKVCSAFDIDEDMAYCLDLHYARLEQAGCLEVPASYSFHVLFPLPGSQEERDGDHLKTLVDTNRSLGNAKRVRRA